MFDHLNPKSSASSAANLPIVFRSVQIALVSAIICSVLLLPAANCFAQVESGNVYSLNPQLRPIVREQFNRAGLSVKWFACLPISESQSVERLFVHESNLYALTAENVLYCLDAQRGVINWATTLASELPTCSAPFFYQDRVLFSLGKTVVQVRLSDGRILQQLELPFNISTAPARTADRLFVGSDENFFYCLRLSDGVTLWQSNCPAEPTANVGISGDNVYFTCKDGALYVSKILERDLVYSFQTFGRIPGFAIDDHKCYIASTDTTLYGIDAETGQPLWDNYLAGGVLSEAPIITNQSIYQTVDQIGLICLDRADGTLQFQLDNGSNLLAEADDVTYAMSLDNELTVMDNRDGSKLLSFLVQDFTISASNAHDSSIFLATDTGAIIVLQPDHAIMH